MDGTTAHRSASPTLSFFSKVSRIRPWSPDDLAETLAGGFGALMLLHGVAGLAAAISL
jgi:hypothetical protein